jgi:predicted nuclease with TOPRIM domain
MREQVETRIENLRAEYRAGQEMLVELEQRRANLQVTLARISGAIQVLEELLQGSYSDAATAKSAASVETKVAA